LKTEKIIIFEEDIKLFRIALELGDFREILSNQNIYFFIGNEPKDTRNRLQEIFTEIDIRRKIKSMKIIALPASIISKETFYQSAMQVVKKAAQQVMILAGNDSFDSIVGLEHILKNIKHIASNPGIKLLYEKFRSKPCIVVAAGPSLKKNIHMLDNLREKALIIACDASLKPMMKYGVRPHLVTSLERTPGTEQFFDDIKNFEGIYHAVCPVVVPAAFETFQGTKIITYRPFSHFDWLGIEKGFVETGISVANMAFKIAQE
ncbi:unnamed protein product, partial [marine sediment metagenome]